MHITYLLEFELKGICFYVRFITQRLLIRFSISLSLDMKRMFFLRSCYKLQKYIPIHEFNNNK